MTLRIVNLTPHHLTLYEGDHPTVDAAPDGPPARVREVRSGVVPVETNLGTIPVVGVRYADDVKDLPDPEPGVRYVVSRVTAAALAGRRDDLLFPLDEVRDEAGAPIGCRALGRFPPPAEA